MIARRMSLLTVSGILVIGGGTQVSAADPAGPPAGDPRRAASAERPVHDVAVTGSGVETYPAFDEQVTRYGVTTGPDTDGTVTVSATSTDPGAQVRIDGQLEADGRRTVTGLGPGDEVAVFVDDAAGRARYSFVYLPAQFPTLVRDTSTLDRPSPGHVLLTLGLWTTPSPFFETAVDANGVPAYVHESPNSSDLKPVGNGHYTVARGTGDAAGASIVELDEQWREVARHRTVGLVNTDNHDSVLLPDGSRYLLAYEPDPDTGLTDAVVQHVSAAGGLLFEWNSAEHVDVAGETMLPGDADYAHVNSLQVMDDGDLLLSFRHLSAVFKVARTAHDGFAAGDVVWRLGGRHSDFSFLAAGEGPETGPCAQHTARELPNGDIMVFDNGAWSLNPLCVDPRDRGGAPVARVPSRIAQWRLDERAGTATTVRDQSVKGRYAIFAGSAQPLPGGGTVVGWASSTDAVASELGPDGELLWDLRDPAPSGRRYFTYRAHKAVVPDAIAPVADLRLPADGATFELGQSVTPDFSCTDRGGSSLADCTLTPISTRTPGSRTVTLTAVDGAGTRTVTRRQYRVVAARPDAAVRRTGSTAYRGTGRYGVSPRQQVALRSTGRAARTAVVRVRNTGDAAGRFTIRPTTRGSRFAVRVTMAGGSATSPVIGPGRSWTGRVLITPRSTVRPGNRALVRLDVVPTQGGTGRDTVWVDVRRR